MTLAPNALLWIPPAGLRRPRKIRPWWRKVKQWRASLSAYLKYGPSGHLLYGPTGHLVEACAGTLPIFICGDHSTCNDPCTGDAAVADGGGIFYRSECCDCPCPGRKAYFRCFQVDIGAVTIKSRANNDDGTYYTFQDIGALSWENANCGTPATYTGNWQKFSAGDVQIDSGTYTVTVESVSANCEASCANDQAGFINLNAAVVAGTPFGSSLLASPSGSFDGARVGDSQSCCVGTDANLVANTFPSIINYPGICLIRPVCVDCDGSDCNSSAGSPAERCGGTITATFEYETTPGVWAMASVDINGGACAWSGTDGGISLAVSTSPVDAVGNPCCPDCDCNDCDGDCPCPECHTPNCPGSCWKGVFGSGYFTETMIFATSSCPSGVGPFSGTHFRNITLSAATGCP